LISARPASGNAGSRPSKARASLRPASTADSPGRPLRINTASNSALLSAAAPRSSKRSRGRSPAGWFFTCPPASLSSSQRSASKSPRDAFHR